MSPHFPWSLVLTPGATGSKQRKAAKIFAETKETLMVSILGPCQRSSSRGLPFWTGACKGTISKRESWSKKHVFLWKDILDGIVFVTMYSKMLKSSKSFHCFIDLSSILATSQKLFKALSLPNLSNGVFHAIHIDGGIIFMLPNWDLENCLMGIGHRDGSHGFVSFQPNYRYILCMYIYI